MFDIIFYDASSQQQQDHTVCVAILEVKRSLLKRNAYASSDKAIRRWRDFLEKFYPLYAFERLKQRLKVGVLNVKRCNKSAQNLFLTDFFHKKSFNTRL
jgi:hypothetical protein